MKYKHKIRQSFTLMEVIVAMAVFSVMMGLLLQMFLGAQKLWTGSDSKNELYSDARVAMDLFASTLQSQYHDPGSTMFLFGTASSGRDDAMFFPVKMPVDYGSEEEIYYLSFIWRAADHTLYMRTLGKKDSRTQYTQLFDQTAGNATNITNKAGRLRDYLRYANGTSQKVIGGVMALSFKPIHAYPGNSTPVSFYNTSGVGDFMNVRGVANTDTREISPFAVQISMELLSARHYDEWANVLGGTRSPEPDAAQQFRLANTRRFDRIIYLGFK